MARFHLRTLVWLTTCAAIGVWLLTLPPRAYWLKYRGETVWAPELDFVERVGLASAIFFAPYAVAFVIRRFRR